jgi:hypothetical protein
MSLFSGAAILAQAGYHRRSAVIAGMFCREAIFSQSSAAIGGALFRVQLGVVLHLKGL